MSARDSVAFFGQFLAQPTAIGAVAPSSQSLASKVVDWIDWPKVRRVVEYGPGTGVFTERILCRILPGTRFLAIEANPRLAATLQRKYPTLSIHADSVRNVRAICDREGLEEVDAIVCGLPWASYSAGDQRDFLEAMMTVLRPGGSFATFAYLQGLLLPAGRRFRRGLGDYFTCVERSETSWLNLPPAFVYRCRR